MQIEIPFSPEEIKDRVIQVISEDVQSTISDNFDHWLRGQTVKVVHERIRALTDEAVRAEFDKLLAEGWTRTDSYGYAQGKRYLKDWVVEYLDRDRYNAPVKEAFNEAMKEALKGEAGRALEEAKQKLRGMLDEGIQAKLRAVLTEAVKP